MARDISAQQRDIRNKARQLAETKGQAWRSLSKEERRSYVSQVREKSPVSLQLRASGNEDSQRVVVRENARKAAEKAGHQWRTLSKDERHAYLAEARKKLR